MGDKLKYWNENDKGFLKQSLADGRTIKWIATTLNKQENTIRQQMFRMGLKSNVRRKDHNPSLNSLRKQAREQDIATRLKLLQNLEVNEAKDIRVFTDQELLSWVNDYPKFIKDVWDIVLQPYQVSMLDIMRNKKRSVFCMGRASGKTFTTSLFALAQCIINPNQKIVIIAPSLRQSKILFDMILRHIAVSDEVFASVQKTKSGTEFVIEFKNGSEVYAVPCGDSGQTIRGFRATHLIAEEGGFIPEEVFSTVEPFLAVSNGSLIIIGTPFGCSGKMWDAFNSSLYERVQLPSYESKFVSKEWLETMKMELSSITWETEIEAKFSELINAFFKDSDIKKCVCDYDFISFPEPNFKYYLGVDWGRKKDSSVVTLIGVDCDNVLWVKGVWEFWNTPFSVQLDFIKGLHKSFGFRSVVAESAGLGIPPSENLKESGLPVFAFVPTVGNKEELFNFLLKQMESGRVKFPSSLKKLIWQLRNFRFELTSSGHMLLHHSSEEVGDDFVDSLAFSVFGVKRAVVISWNVY